jgi:restriction system protein
MLRPILALATEKDITRKTSAAAMEDHFHLTPDERAARIPSGSSTYVQNRNGWAMTFLTKAGLIAKVAPRTYRATDFGRKYLTEHPKAITERDLRSIPGWQEAWKTTKREESAVGDTAGKTPIEALDQAIATINADVKSRLLATILEQSPSFFEQLVLDVLVAMGYGGSPLRNRRGHPLRPPLRPPLPLRLRDALSRFSRHLGTTAGNSTFQGFAHTGDSLSHARCVGIRGC